jgi:tetratricopeptide (TPR) repeat protein
LNVENGRIADAAKLYHRILQRNANSLNALLRLGKCFYLTEDYPSALLCYEQVLRYEPANCIALEAIGMLRAVEPSIAAG